MKTDETHIYKEFDEKGRVIFIRNDERGIWCKNTYNDKDEIIKTEQSNGKVRVTLFKFKNKKVLHNPKSNWVTIGNKNKKLSFSIDDWTNMNYYWMAKRWAWTDDDTNQFIDMLEERLSDLKKSTRIKTTIFDILTPYETSLINKQLKGLKTGFQKSKLGGDSSKKHIVQRYDTEIKDL